MAVYRPTYTTPNGEAKRREALVVRVLFRWQANPPKHSLDPEDHPGGEIGRLAREFRQESERTGCEE
jgi:hypothetical protein